MIDHVIDCLIGYYIIIQKSSLLVNHMFSFLFTIIESHANSHHGTNSVFEHENKIGTYSLKQRLKNN